MMRCLVHLRDFLHCRRNNPSGPGELRHYVPDLRNHYQETKDILTCQRERLAAYEKKYSSVPEVPLSTKVHCACQAGYGVGLVIAIVYNCVLSALSPEDGDLGSDSTAFVSDVLALAKEARKYRPLGSSFVAPCLGAAWVGTTFDNMKLEVERVWEEYGGDLVSGLRKLPLTELTWISRQLRLID